MKSVFLLAYLIWKVTWWSWRRSVKQSCFVYCLSTEIAIQVLKATVCAYCCITQLSHFPSKCLWMIFWTWNLVQCFLSRLSGKLMVDVVTLTLLNHSLSLSHIALIQYLIIHWQFTWFCRWSFHSNEFLLTTDRHLRYLHKNGPPTDFSDLVSPLWLV